MAAEHRSDGEEGEFPLPEPAAPQGQGPDSAKGQVRRVYPPKGGSFAAELASAAEAFNRGDFRWARSAAQQVVRSAATEEERAFAVELLRRTGVDPVAVIVGAIAAGLCIWALLSAWAS